LSEVKLLDSAKALLHAAKT